MVDILTNERGPFQILFGDDASISPNIVIPIVTVIIVALFILVIRIVLKDKGRADMTEEELEKDRALVDKRHIAHAEYMGEEYDASIVRAREEEEIAEARKRYDKAVLAAKSKG